MISRDGRRMRVCEDSPAIKGRTERQMVWFMPAVVANEARVF